MAVIPVYEGRDPYIFISYAHKDSSLVLPVVSGLFEEKYRLWYDEGIPPGSEWPHNIAVHLENADTVIAFVSDNSADSANCENEIVRAKELGKNIVVYQVDGRDHEALEKCAHADSRESLGKLLDKRLIGDGVTGYSHSSAARGRSVLWDIVLGFALVMVIALAAGLFGLNKGWFDEYLPGRQTAAAEAEQPENESADEIENDVLAEAILSKIGKEDLMKELSFSSGEMRRSFYAALDEDGDAGSGSGGGLTYFDLTNDHRGKISLAKADEETLALLKYFPELKTAEIKSGDISSLAAAAECPKLEVLALGYDVFPVEIPEEARFTVKVLD